MRSPVIMLSAFILPGIACASPASLQKLTDDMNQRLAVMKDVAGYKAQNHLAVEDLSREKTVLAQATAKAEKAGLDVQSITPFIQAQMDVAKAIQYRFRADWLSQPETNWQPQPLTRVRARISVLDAQLMDDIISQLKMGTFSAADQAEMLKKLQAPNISKADAKKLVTTLAATRLKK